jgi:hypothetical protein
MDVHDELKALRREIEDLKFLMVSAHWEREKWDELEAALERERDRRRYGKPTALYHFRLGPVPADRLYDSGFVTLDEVAERSREEIASINGVGPKTLDRLDAAMQEHGLSYSEPS